MNSQPSTLNYFTASALARAAGVSKVALVRRLARTPSRATVIVHGNPASVWSIDDLPLDYRNAIAQATQRAGCRTLHDFISQAPALWQPAIPLSEVAPEAADKAARLRRALTRVLQLRADPNTSGADLERIGLADFKKEFGYSITGRTLRNLIRRTVERDNLADNFNRLEIYLDGNCARAATAPPAVLAQSGDLRVIYDCLAAFQDQRRPRPREIEELWERVLRLHHGQIIAGITEKQSRLELLAFLWNSAPWLAKTRNALRVQFAYNHQLVKSAGYDYTVLREGRHARKGIPVKPPIPQARINDISAYALFACGGRIAQACREVDEWAAEHGIESELSGAFLGEMSRRSSVVQTPALTIGEIAGGRRLTPAPVGARMNENGVEVLV